MMSQKLLLSRLKLSKLRKHSLTFPIIKNTVFYLSLWLSDLKQEFYKQGETVWITSVEKLTAKSDNLLRFR